MCHATVRVPLLSKGSAASAASDFEAIARNPKKRWQILPIPKLVGIARIATRVAFPVHEFV
jgi:hypothetical protein